MCLPLWQVLVFVGLWLWALLGWRSALRTGRALAQSNEHLIARNQERLARDLSAGRAPGASP